MKCRDVMTPDPTTIHPSQSVTTVAQQMRQADVGPIPVVDDQARLLGIVTDRDVVLRVVAEGKDPENVRVGDVMTKSPSTCRADDDLGVALAAMKEHQIRRVPVIDDGGKLVGIVAQADVATRGLDRRTTAKVVEAVSREEPGAPEARERDEGFVDKSITKVSAKTAPRGPLGQRYLASGIKLSMRLWNAEPPGPATPSVRRDYETVGFVVSGRAELDLAGQRIALEPGDSWIVPRGTPHAYRILETFTAVEATTPPAEVHGRDRQAAE